MSVNVPALTDRKTGAVPPAEGEGGRRDLLTVERKPDGVRRAVRVVEQVRESGAEELASREPGEMDHLLVHVGDGEFRVDRDEPVERRLDEPPVVVPRLPGPLLERPLRGPVAGHEDDALDLALGAPEDRRARRDEQLVARPELERQLVVRQRTVRERLLDAHHRAPRVGEQVPEPASHELLAGESGDEDGLLVHVGDRHRRIDDHHHVGGRLDETPVIVLGRAKAGLGLRLLGDVAGRGEDPPRLAELPVEHGGVHGNGSWGSHLGPKGEDEVSHAAGRQDRGDCRRRRRGVGEVLREFRSEDLVPRETDHDLRLPVQVGDRALGVNREQRVDRRFDEPRL